MGDHPDAISLDKYGIDLLKTIPYGSKRYILLTPSSSQYVKLILIRKFTISIQNNTGLGSGRARAARPQPGVVLDTYGELPDQDELDVLARRRGQQDVTFTAVGYGLQEINPVFVQADRIRMVAHPHLIQINVPGFTGDFLCCCPTTTLRVGLALVTQAAPTSWGGMRALWWPGLPPSGSMETAPVPVVSSEWTGRMSWTSSIHSWIDGEISLNENHLSLTGARPIAQGKAVATPSV